MHGTFWQSAVERLFGQHLRLRTVQAFGIGLFDHDVNIVFELFCNIDGADIPVGFSRASRTAWTPNRLIFQTRGRAAIRTILIPGLIPGTWAAGFLIAPVVARSAIAGLVLSFLRMTLAAMLFVLAALFALQIAFPGKAPDRTAPVVAAGLCPAWYFSRNRWYFLMIFSFALDFFAPFPFSSGFSFLSTHFSRGRGERGT